MKKLKIKPRSDSLLVEREKPPEKTRGGIVLPENAQEKAVIGTVMAVGVGELVEGHRVPLDYQIGDKVIWNKFSGMEHEVDGQTYLFVRAEDVVASIEE